MPLFGPVGRPEAFFLSSPDTSSLPEVLRVDKRAGRGPRSAARACCGFFRGDFELGTLSLPSSSSSKSPSSASSSSSKLSKPIPAESNSSSSSNAASSSLKLITLPRRVLPSSDEPEFMTSTESLKPESSSSWSSGSLYGFSDMGGNESESS